MKNLSPSDWLALTAIAIAAFVAADRLLAKVLTWRTSAASACGETGSTTYEPNASTATFSKSTTPKPAHRSLNPYREIRRLKVEVADAVACRDETQRLLEMQYVSLVEVVKAVNYMSSTGIAIQTKVGKA